MKHNQRSILRSMQIIMIIIKEQNVILIYQLKYYFYVI